MARALHRSHANLRYLLWALLALVLVARVGGCEAVAAVSLHGGEHVHCPDMPPKPGKLVKAEMPACALCAALPVAAPAPAAPDAFAKATPPQALAAQLLGLASGPAPPPPQTV